ncbi:MAG: phytanoyl-CoA dioxygenase family protein [Candidatus Poribacteria bacterium]|nr:phytanoyl-CoA dioxygenase family protein [Candidatus Poribacteria bacterium]
MGTNSEKFTEQGYLVVQSVLAEADLAPLIAVVSEVVEARTTELYNEGIISDTYKGMSFEHRWHAVLKACGRENEVFGWHTLVFSEALFDLITHPKVLDVLESLIGSDIQFNGDFWVRPKLPNEKLTTLPWHQDSAYMPNTETDTHLTVWLPLVDVKTENGALQFLPGSHKSGLQTYHRVPGEAFAVPVLSPTAPDTDIHTLEMKKGDLLVFNNLVFHRSLFNRSDIIRWSVDFRFSPTATSLDGLWHEAIACPARESTARQCPTPWQTWRAQWEASPHKDRFV